GLAIDQIAQSGLSSLSVIYYSAQLFRALACNVPFLSAECTHDVSGLAASACDKSAIQLIARSIVCFLITLISIQ
ncbi:hypothetical protein, partial [Klebsiella quasipneumoniae]|uniref:hypothetical protein n=1 Tax=Klebsiella quasipneumoniae TaxID=1463165 RepID=UPI00280C271B